MGTKLKKTQTNFQWCIQGKHASLAFYELLMHHQVGFGCARRSLSLSDMLQQTDRLELVNLTAIRCASPPLFPP